jgi:predicted ArsR family transcriptional regulator
MSDEDPLPPDDTRGTARSHWVETTDTFDRIHDIAIGLREPTPVPEIAETAACSPNAARKHLDRLADMGVLVADYDGRPARFHRNDAYIEWRRANTLAREHSREELHQRLEALEEREASFRDRYETDDPGEVNVFEHESHARIHEIWDDLGDWQTIRRDKRSFELARRMIENDGHIALA